MKNGGNAFPCYIGDNMAECGMTLRDYFAGQALIGLLVGWSSDFPDSTLNKEGAEGFAVESYRMAAALIAEREKKGEENG